MKIFFLLLTILPAGATQYIKPPVVTAGAEFGAAIAIDSDTMVIGSPKENDSTGAAYIYTKDNGQWIFQSRLEATDKESGFRFGSSVAISGDTIVIGSPAHGDSSGSFFVDPSGAAYVFVRVNGTWAQQQILIGNNTGDSDNFGTSVAIDVDTIAIGARFEAGPGNTMTDSGAAYVFSRSGTTWTQQAYLKATDTSPLDEFGTAVAVSGNTVAVGAPFGDITEHDEGAVHIFEKGSAWNQAGILLAMDLSAGDFFGTSLALSGQTLLIGARGQDSFAPGSGAAYIFEKSSGAWKQEARLKASPASPNAAFGTSVALSGERAVCGAPGESKNGNNSGSAWHFHRDSSGWGSRIRLLGDFDTAGDGFGGAVAVSGLEVGIGAKGEDAAGNSSPDSGAAFTFTLFPNSFSEWTAERKLTGSDALEDADPDHDGIPNLLTYALGSGGTIPVFNSGSLGFSRSTTIPVDAILHIEQSTDLITWDELARRGDPAPWTGDFAANVSEIAQSGIITVTALPDDPQPAEPALFMRLKATRLPDN